MSLCWVTALFNFYMIAFLLKNLPGNIYLNGLAASIAEIFSFVVSGFMYKHKGLKLSLIFFFGISALGGLGMLVY